MKRDNGQWRGQVIALLLAGVTLAAAHTPLCAAPPRRAADQPAAETPPTLTVTGKGEYAARPDRAVLQLGAVAQAEQAAEAQEQVNAMGEALEAIRDVVGEEGSISTVGISLQPVYTDRHARLLDGQPPPEPRIIGYRAGNRLRVVIDDLTKVGDVIDAGVRAGANQVEGLSFELKDDTAARRGALTDAANQASDKATALAAALGVRIERVLAVKEGHVDVVRPRMELARAGVAAMDMATPVQPGNVDVSASVTVTYRVSPGRDANE